MTEPNFESLYKDLIRTESIDIKRDVHEFQMKICRDDRFDRDYDMKTEYFNMSEVFDLFSQKRYEEAWEKFRRLPEQTQNKMPASFVMAVWTMHDLICESTATDNPDEVVARVIGFEARRRVLQAQRELAYNFVALERIEKQFPGVLDKRRE